MGTMLQYDVMETPDGYIATCANNSKISVFCKKDSDLDYVIHEAAKLYASKHADDPHAVLLDGKTRMERRSK
ncbi:MAG: hypothetical protein OXI27_02580 [Thaumarchaeota archaeon]|nr:hypothetical protein [Nitrososphaerota archaeon]MDE0525472.1 hypothetical protein [Nitrososphaerota archaeon]